MAAAGVEIAAIVDSRDPDPAVQSLLPGVEKLSRSQVVKAHGYKRLSGVTVRAGDGGTRRIDCDLVAMSGGWNPTAHLFSQSRGTMSYSDEKCCFVPDKPAQNAVCVGAANGEFDLTEALSNGASEPRNRR